MKTILMLLLMLTFCFSKAQDAPFKQLRYDESYKYLAQDSAADWYHRLKFNPLSSNKATYVSFGGEVRYQYFYFQNQDWGESPKDPDGFILSRYLGHLDFHAGRHFRAFVQLQSSLANGQVEEPSPVDQNLLDLHQAFLEYFGQIGNGANLSLRVGRQELSYGSQRLVAVREAPNNRQSFDAAKLMYSKKNAKLDIFYAHYVPARPKIFDDRFSDATQFWGAYGVLNKIPVLKNIDLYYFGIHKKSAVFNDAKGIETRHSIGTRIWGNSPIWQYDIEGLYQFGKLQTSSISSWTISANLSHSWDKARFKPQIGIKTELISGDKHLNDGRLNTFNPLFPKGAYFGLAALIGPYNLMDAHPYVQFDLAENLSFAVDYDLFWRMDRNDGLYAVNGRLIYPSGAGYSRQIGKQLGGALDYAPNKYLTFKQEVTWFEAGNYLKSAGPGKDILMLGTTATLKF